ncbi:ATP-binding protein [Streptomyces sp. NPDC052236]|uniref:ATP-binding protein n=1 Tax=Streptomyces sp. NPDC052236 TaxID=3365686 RepID=UPI0037D5236E
MTGRQGEAGAAATGGRAREPRAEGEARNQLRRRLGRAELTAVPEVRHALRDLLRQWGKRDTAEVAELLASELVTNALVHTDEGAVVTATVDADTLRVEVRDFVAGLPVEEAVTASHVATADHRTHGRGLLLVQSLADAWGVCTHGMGKVVWFELYERPV